MNLSPEQLAAADGMAVALEALLRQTSNIEVLGEWSALEINRTLQKTTRTKIDTVIAVAEDALAKWQEVNK